MPRGAAVFLGTLRPMRGGALGQLRFDLDNIHPAPRQFCRLDVLILRQPRRPRRKGTAVLSRFEAFSDGEAVAVGLEGFREIEQGFEMGQPSEVALEAEFAGGHAVRGVLEVG